jgi:hypothetical protein
MVREQLLLFVREYVTVVIPVLFTFVLVLLLLFCIWIISLQ